MNVKTNLYKRKILRELYFNNILSCADLSLKTNKSIPLTTKILNELIEGGYVVETGFAQSTGGRRPLMFSLQQDVMYIVSVAMDQFVTRIALLDMHNTNVTAIEKFELNLYQNKNALHVLTEKLHSFVQKLHINREKIAGIGIAMPGFVDVKKGINYS